MIKRIRRKISRIVRLPYLNSLLRSTPVNKEWGFARGLPIDRFYIQRFLSSNKALIRGNVLAIGDDHYTKLYGGKNVTKSDVLNINSIPTATIVADLSDAPLISSNKFDCFLLIQTLQLIYDFRGALETTHRILKPGGVLLATFPGITPLKDEEWNHTWYWNFTTNSAKRMFEEFFDSDKIEVRFHGNVKSAVGFLHGLSVADFNGKGLLSDDSAFPVIITVKATK